MAAGLAKRHLKRTRDDQIDPAPPTRKRPRRVADADNNGKGEDNHEEPSQQCKRLKVHTKPQERQPEVQETLPPLPRRSPRLQKLRESRIQLSSREQKPIGRSFPAAQYRDWKVVQTQKASARSHKVFLKQGNSQGSPLNSLTAKRRRNPESGELHRVSKRQRRQSVSGHSIEQADLIERWLDESYPDQEPLIVDKALEATDTMPRKPAAVLPSPVDSFDRTTSTSRRSERSTASVHDPDYRQSLRHRNINIERENAPTELMRRAHRIIARPRASPEMDDIAVQELKEKSRQLQEDAEEEIVQQLAPNIIPAMKRLPDKRLARNADQPWTNSVSVPLDPSILTNPLPLPKPKPDLAFGYSQAAFTRNQLGTIELLVDDQFGRSFAVPDQKLRFPFLDIEFKSQAKNGTHYSATNQAAGAGAIVLRGTLDLVERSFGIERFDYEEPKFFSVTMDHQLACVNVHWLKAPVDGGKHSFHVEGLSQHLLKDADGIRAISRAIKNILDYGADKRLRILCETLDEYRAIVVRNREAADPQRVRAQAIVQSRSGDVTQKPALEDTSTRSTRHAPMPRQASANDLITEQRKTKQGRHEPNIAQNVRLSKPAIAPTSTTRYGTVNARKSGYNVTRQQPSNLFRHTAAAVESKRQIKPSQKLLESRKHLIDSQGVKPRSRHEL